jgi:hypothetical protein
LAIAPEQVGGLACKVTALEQHRPGGDAAGGFEHGRAVSNREAGERFGLGQVRGD